MQQTEPPREPSAMSRRKAIAYAIGLPLSLLGLIFLPAGTIAWRPGWIFLAVLILGFGASGLVLAWVNPVIYRAHEWHEPLDGLALVLRQRTNHVPDRIRIHHGLCVAVMRTGDR
jgi:hypothetical protein